MTLPGYVTVEVTLIRRETERAFLVYLDHIRLEWIPKSAVANATDYRPGDWYCLLEVRGWLAEEKGML